MIGSCPMQYAGGVRFLDGSPGLGFIDPVTATFVAQGVGMGVSWLLGRQGGQQKRSATAIVEEAARLLQENLDLVRAGEISKSDALSNFDLVWGRIVEGCSPLGAAGQRCISERQAGSNVTCFVAGVEQSCDFFALYRDPILNLPDGNAIPANNQPGAVASPGAVAASGAGSPSVFDGNVGYLALAGVALMGIFFMGGKA